MSAIQTHGIEGSVKIAVLIATCDRPDLLARRALTSLQRQTSFPDYVVVVDDSDPKTCPDNRNIVNDLRLPKVRIIYLKNTRHAGACGAWNTGLEWLRRHAGNPNAVFVAVLDDDDEWEPAHLAVCREAVANGHFDMVAPAIVRKTANESEHIQIPPPTLDPSQFLVGNPHIQGSNLFLRLDALLEAGAFDESLTSSTDRDLCIRLADLGWVRYSPIEQPTVRHHAETNRPRMSSPGGDSKQRGLDRFWSKWHGRMTEQQQDACLRRAKDYFNWSPATPSPAVALPSVSYFPARDPSKNELVHADDLVLVVGVITDAGHTNQFRRLLDQLLALQRFDQICCLDVVVLHNGGPQGELDQIIADYRAHGLAMLLASEQQQIEDADRGAFGGGFKRPLGRAPIGPARTMLQTYVTRVATQRQGAIAWILDDDSSLENFCDPPTPLPFAHLLASLKQMQSMGAEVVLGSVTGDPPVPPGSSVRIQLVDLYHNLGWLLRLDPESELVDRSADNRHARAAARDFYYDLSRRDTHHLEWPFWLIPDHSGERVGSAIARMIKALPRILAGQSLFRPLVLDPTRDPTASMRPSVQRGTNTFVFDLAAFVEFPNAAPTFAGATLRRSDMIWSLLNRYAGGRRIVSAMIPVRHDRSDEKVVGLDFERLLPDMHGYALYSALEEVLIRRRERRLREGIGAEQPDNLKFTSGDLDFAVGRFRKFLTERTAALLWSCWRIQGLCKTIARISESACATAAGWSRHPDRRMLSDFIEQTRSCFSPDRVQRIVKDATEIPAQEVRSFLQSLPTIVEAHRQATPLLPHEDSWFHRERRAAALPLARSVAGTDPLRFLGAGSEGVVFATGARVIKVIDYSKRSPANGAWRGLAILARRNTPLVSLYLPALPKVAAGRTLISYPLDSSEAYLGGHTNDFLQLLRDCKAVGVVTTNLHPKNLVVTPDGVRLIDYGSDIRPLSAMGFASMVQRVWLTLHYHNRADLADLMRRSLNDDSLPELEGWESLLAALEPPGNREVIEDALLEFLRSWKPRRVLDFGCGSGRLAAELAQEGIEVTAFDPDETLVRRWQNLNTTKRGEIHWLTGAADTALAGSVAGFDTIICSLVLCAIEKGHDYDSALKSLSDALCDGGRFLVVVCNPAATLAGDSSLQRRIVPGDADDAKVFTWVKHLPSGRQRRDVHRPLERITADLSNVGLQVNHITATGGISLATLFPSRDFLILSGTKCRNASVVKSEGTSCRCGPVPRFPDSLPVLCYHRVLPEGWNDEVSFLQRKRGTVVDLQVFHQQLDDVQKNLRPVTLAEYLLWLDGECQLPANSCLITFDDGYRDFLDFALPLLRSRQMPSVLFATMASARGEGLLPVDTLYSALSAAQRETRLHEDEIVDWLTGSMKRRFIHASIAEQTQLLKQAGLQPVELDPSKLYLTEAELVRLSAEGVALGGHGCRHELLIDKKFPEIRAELRRVRFWLESLNHGRESMNLSFAYPNGNYDSVAIAAAIEAGFTAAFTVEPSQKGMTNHRWRLNRSCIPNRTDAITGLVAGKEIQL